MLNSKLRVKLIDVLLGVLSCILMYLAFPILPMFPFLKLDFSLVIIIVTLCLFGLKNAILVTIIRNLLFFILNGFSLINGLNGLSSFIAAFVFIMIVAFLQKYTNVLWTFVGSVLLSSIILAAVNYIFLLPAFLYLMNIKTIFGGATAYIWGGVVPFNLISYTVNFFAGAFLAKRLKRFRN